MFQVSEKITSKRKNHYSDNKVDKTYNIMVALWQNNVNIIEMYMVISFGEVVASKIGTIPTAY
jgi:hypothetical protein